MTEKPIMINLTRLIPDTVEHVVFDWNGTLLDDVHHCIAVTNSLLAENDLPFLSHERYRRTFRFPVCDYYRDLGFDLGKVPFEALSDLWMGRYNAGVKGVDLFEQSEELIRQLREDGVPLAILSAAMESDIHELLRHHGLDGCFEEVFGLDHSHANSKLQRGRELLECLGCDAGKVLLIGDTDHDFEVGSSLGIHTLLLADGHQDFRRLASLPCPVLESRYA